jgi:hypothetical protein
MGLWIEDQMAHLHKLSIVRIGKHVPSPFWLPLMRDPGEAKDVLVEEQLALVKHDFCPRHGQEILLIGAHISWVV